MIKDALTLSSELIAHRRTLHKHAEVGFDLPRTRAYVMEQLTAMGYAPQEVGGGIVAIAGGKQPGRTFLLRADMDALPIVEENDLPYCSSTSNMHACGHDLHTAMLLGAAQLLKQREDSLRGTVKLMFQPAEEIMGGARRMIEAGVLTSPDVDAAMMIHVAPGIPARAGTAIFIGDARSYAACDWFEILVRGKGGHGAMPNTTIDPLNVISHIHIALQAIIAREVGPMTPAVVTVGEMHGGTVSNVIPDTAVLRGTIRTFDEKERTNIKERLSQIAALTASAFRAEADITFSMECPAVAGNGELDDALCRYAQQTIGVDRVVTSQQFAALASESGIGSGMGSEDFAYVAQKVPATCAILVAGSPADGYTYPPHHPKVRFDEDALCYGAAVYAGCAISYLVENAL